MAYLRRILLMHKTLSLVVRVLSQATSEDGFITIEVQWSNRTYDLDGPWRMVTVGVGSLAQLVDLIPGQYYSSTVFSPAGACSDESETVNCSLHSIYDPTLSNTAITNLIRNGTNDWAQPVPMTGFYYDVADDILVSFNTNFDNYPVRTTGISITDSATMSYPKGDIPVTVGSLCLGASLDPWDFPQNNNNTEFTAPVLPNYYADNDNKTTASGSFGMHIGAVEPDLPSSLWYGGYDASRVVGTVATGYIPSHDTEVQLVDISIGGLESVADEYDITVPSGVIADYVKSTSAASFIVQINPGQPYLVLPKPVCDSLTSKLLVIHDDGLALYTWNSMSPRYPYFIQSPQYLNSSFLSNDGSTVSIAVPLMLQNLTLSPPLVNTTTFYFPCFTATDPQEGYWLGRAFLQSAFFGAYSLTIHGPAQWLLAQAPGPGLRAPDSRVMFYNDNNASVLSYWQQRLGLPIGNGTNATTSSGNGTLGHSGNGFGGRYELNAGAKAGISVNIILGAAAIYILAIRLRRRMEQQARIAPDESMDERVMPDSNNIIEAGGREMHELDNSKRTYVFELPS